MKMVHIQKKEELAQIVGKYFKLIAFVRDLLPSTYLAYWLIQDLFMTDMHVFLLEH